MRTYKKISVGKLVVVVLCALLLPVVSQNLAFNIGLLLTKTGLSAMIGNIMIAMLYIGFTYLAFNYCIKIFLHLDVSFLRMPDMRKKNIFRAVWVVTAVFMPILAVFGFSFSRRRLVQSKYRTRANESVDYGNDIFLWFCSGSSRRNDFPRCDHGNVGTENRASQSSTFFLSILFAVVHMVGGSFDVMSMLQLLVSGSW